MDTKCRSLNKAGEPCSAAHYKDGWCHRHHPDLEAQRQAERRAGGKAKANTERARKELTDAVMTLEEVDGLLCLSIIRVATGQMAPGVGAALGSLARSIIAVRDAGELTDRLDRLEVAVHGRQGA